MECPRAVRAFFVTAVAAALLGASGCGTESAPDTVGQTLAEAKTTLEDKDVKYRVVGAEAEADPATVTVCTQTPDNATVEDTVDLDVAATCPQPAAEEQQEEEDDDDRKKKKRKRK
jgi:energy-coupling factor transporter ATP-binding protein EcfA2